MTARTLIFLLSLISLFGVPSQAQTTPDLEERKVLVAYQGRELGEAVFPLFREGFHMPANYLGLLPTYLDISKAPLPDPASLHDFRAVVTSFSSDAMPDPEGFMHWINRILDSGRFVVVIGRLGYLTSSKGNPVDQALLNSTLKRVGISRKEEPTLNGILLRYGKKAGRLAEFERALPPIPPRYDGFEGVDLLETWLSVTHRQTPGSQSPAVAISRTGGFAMAGFTHWQDPVTFKKQWYLDPFTFLQKSLRLDGIPVPTPTTLSGRRVAFSHIDADGFTGPTRIDPTLTCGEVIRDEILTRINMPVTVSLIQAEVDPVYAKTDRFENIARTIFRLPNVEPASHGFSHPFYWNAENKTLATRYQEDYGYSQFGVKVPGYEVLDSFREIKGSADYISTLSPEDKPCRVMQWSGACDPGPKNLGVAEQAGILNINGGDTVFDQVRNSHFKVAPICAEQQGYYQYFTGQANENILTNLWVGPLFGFRNITETMKRTELPRRLAPINIYYHFYSGEYPASLKAVKDVYAWVASQETAPIFTSRYLEMARGFTTAKITRSGEHAFSIREYGRCTTLRLDNAGTLRPDLSQSLGVLGYRTTPQGLFIHLAPDRAEARLVLAHSPDNPPFLEHASGVVRKFNTSNAGISFEYDGAVPGSVIVTGISPNAGYIVTTDESSPVLKAKKAILTIPVSATGNVILERQ